MIKADRENIQIGGTIFIICAELAGIVNVVYASLAEKYDDDFARKTIAKAGQMAFMSDEELNKAAEEKIKEIKEMVELYEQE